MTKIYLKFPEITKIKANIVSRRYQDEQTQVILDRTIFMPKTGFLLNDLGTISGFDVLSVEDKKNNIIHLINGKPNSSKVELSINRDIRMRNLYYNTAFVLFKIFFHSFYNNGNLSLNLNVDRAEIIIDKFEDYFDKDLISDQINFAISKSLKIKNQQGITSLRYIGDTINNEICFNNTAKVLGFKINDIKNIDQKLIIDFLCGSDILK